MFVVWVVISSELCVFMDYLDCVEVCSFSAVFQRLHCVVNGAKEVVVFQKVLGKFGRMAVSPKCVFVLIKPYCKTLSCLTHIRFLTVRAHEFIYP